MALIKKPPWNPNSIGVDCGSDKDTRLSEYGKDYASYKPVL